MFGLWDFNSESAVLNWGNIVYVLQGIPITLLYTMVALCLSLLFAIALSLLSRSKIKSLSCLIRFYISIFRGTPLLVQLSIIYFGSSYAIGVNLSALTAGIAAFSLNSSAYVAEIIRSGIQSIDEGQFEAAKALHIPVFLMWKDIIFPQAFRNIFPALVNESLTLLKDTALISTIGGLDVMRRASLLGAEYYSYLPPLLLAAFIYYILVIGLSYGAKCIEKRLQYD